MQMHTDNGGEVAVYDLPTTDNVYDLGLAIKRNLPRKLTMTMQKASVSVCVDDGARYASLTGTADTGYVGCYGYVGDKEPVWTFNTDLGMSQPDADYTEIASIILSWFYFIGNPHISIEEFLAKKRVEISQIIWEGNGVVNLKWAGRIIRVENAEGQLSIGFGRWEFGTHAKYLICAHAEVTADVIMPIINYAFNPFS